MKHSLDQGGVALLRLTPAKWQKHLEQAILLLLFLAAGFSIYTLYSRTFWLNFIEPLAGGLEQVGVTDLEKGLTSRKTQVDPLWLPLNDKLKVYSGDIITTGKDSFVNIDLIKDIKINVEPESLVRIRIFQGKPLIRISNGQIKIILDRENSIFIKKGSKIEELTLRKGTYIIKNDGRASLSITAQQDEMNVAEGKSEEKEKKQMLTETKAEDEKIPQSESAESNEQAIAPNQSEATAVEVAPDELGDFNYDLPYPEQNKLFLVMGPAPIYIAAKTNCPDECNFVLVYNNGIIKKIHQKKGDVGIFSLEPNELKNGKYNWIYESESLKHESTFYVDSYNEDSLQKAIEAQQPVEVLSPTN